MSVASNNRCIYVTPKDWDKIKKKARKDKITVSRYLVHNVLRDEDVKE